MPPEKEKAPLNVGRGEVKTSLGTDSAILINSENLLDESSNIKENTEPGPQKPPPFLLARSIPFSWAALAITIVGGVMAVFILKTVDMVTMEQDDFESYSYGASVKNTNAGDPDSVL